MIDVKRVSDLMGSIAEASAEQSRGVQQVNKTVTEMDKVVQQNASAVQQSAVGRRGHAPAGRVAGARGEHLPPHRGTIAPRRRSAMPTGPHARTLRGRARRRPGGAHAGIAAGAQGARPPRPAGSDDWEEF